MYNYNKTKVEKIMVNLAIYNNKKGVFCFESKSGKQNKTVSGKSRDKNNNTHNNSPHNNVDGKLIRSIIIF
jgi:hypothetical protein